MPVKIFRENLSVDDLVTIYQLFCKAFDIEIDEIDKRFFRRNGLEHLSQSIGLEYRAFEDTKFFGTKIGKTYYF